MRQNIIRYNRLIGLLFLFFASCVQKKASLPEKVTFTEHVAPLLYKHCTVCHRPEGGAHFWLLSYAQVKPYAASIAYVCKEKLMPPWPADANYTHFVGEKILTDFEISLLQKWISDSVSEGPKDKLPPLPNYPIGSLVGTPDMRILVTPTFLKANASDKFLLVKIPFELPADTFAALVEFEPGRQHIVHHVNGDMIKYDYYQKTDVFGGERVVDMKLDSTIMLAFAKLGLANDDGSYPLLQKSVVNYLPGAYGQLYPPGIGGYKLTRKGAFLLNDLHYGFTGKDSILDSSYINVFFAKNAPKRPLLEFQLGTLGIAPVEPNLIVAPNTVKNVYSKFTIPKDISILTINPHMHLIGKSFKAYALKPDGDTIRLISIPRWDFNWQYFYTFPKMVKIPKGSTIIAEGVYDNTAKNINNPYNPPQIIQDKNGSMRGTDEMFQFIINYLPYQDGDENISLETSGR